MMVDTLVTVAYAQVAWKYGQATFGLNKNQQSAQIGLPATLERAEPEASICICTH
jgi:hypothetical protein